MHLLTEIRRGEAIELLRVKAIIQIYHICLTNKDSSVALLVSSFYKNKNQFSKYSASYSIYI